MILSCPSCATRYLIDPAALGETGRMVRCARCSHTWTERPPEDMPKQVDVLPPVEQVEHKLNRCPANEEEDESE